MLAQMDARTDPPKHLTTASIQRYTNAWAEGVRSLPDRLADRCIAEIYRSPRPSPMSFRLIAKQLPFQSWGPILKPRDPIRTGDR